MNARLPASARVRRFDAYHFLALYLALLFIIPARLIVPGMGSGGSPASLLALVGFGWWAVATLVPGQREFRRRNPVRTALGCYLAVVVLTWTLGKMRPLTPLESTTSDRAILMVFGLAGIALVAMDGIRSREEIERLVRWTLGVSMVMVVIGFVQFFFDRDLSKMLHVPGLVFNTEIHEIKDRAIFNRPHGTTLHPIEYGVVSGALVPLAYWMVRRHGRPWTYAVLAAVGFAAMTSISRSAVLALAVVLAVLIAGFGWQQRIALGVGALVFVVAAGTAVGGLVGTLTGLFTSVDTDSSVQARVSRFPRMLELLSEHPWLGRGFGTYNPIDYFLLDNEIQKTAIETGLIGLTVLVLFIGFVATMAWRTRLGDEHGWLPGTALAAVILGLFVSFYTFDAFFYRILTGMLYLSIGLVGAMYRLTEDRRRFADATREISATATPLERVQ